MTSEEIAAIKAKAEAFLERSQKKRIVQESASNRVMNQLHDIMDSVPITSPRHAKIQEAYTALDNYMQAHSEAFEKSAKAALKKEDTLDNVERGERILGTDGGFHSELMEKMRPMIQNATLRAEMLQALYEKNIASKKKKKRINAK